MVSLKYFLGFQIEQFAEGTFISQTKYIQDMFVKFDMKYAKPCKTPMPTKGYLDQDLSGIPFDATLYRSMIGSLLYLCASRPDIMFSVGMCARYQASPMESHHLAVKSILRYLVHTPLLGLWYPQGSQVWSIWVHGCGLGWRQGGSKVNLRFMPIPLALIDELALQEAKLCLPLHRRSRICCRRKLC